MRSLQDIDASPTKAFFIDNLTRDLTLEDAVLDLIDNSVDAATLSHRFDVSAKLLEHGPPEAPAKSTIAVRIDSDRISVEDDAGGIDPERALREVFRLGRLSNPTRSSLGVYGIGLKRAVFKMGRRITITSTHPRGAFRVAITPDWLDDETNWTLPLEKIPPAAQHGTSVVVEQLRPEIAMRVGDPRLLKRLKDTIRTTYTLFLDRLIAVTLNGTPVEGKPIPIGHSEEIHPGQRHLDEDGVHVELLVGLAPRKDGVKWRTEQAGWYVLCNGRAVVFADKTELTGWGAGGPQFAAKYRGFVGVAFFFSDDPSSLPWTTTKRGLNRESRIFQLARNEMKSAARPVLRFLNDMYPSDVKPETVQRDLTKQVSLVPLHELTARAGTSFRTPSVVKKDGPRMVNVQFKALVSDIEHAKKCIAKPKWSAKKVAEHALRYFLRHECAE